MSAHPRSWNWNADGLVVSGAYVRLAEAPSAYGPVPVLTLDVDGELRSVWLSQTALRREFVNELDRRKSGDFDPGERIRIERGAEKVRGGEVQLLAVQRSLRRCPRRRRSKHSRGGLVHLGLRG